MPLRITLPALLWALSPLTHAEPGLVVSYSSIARRVQLENPELAAARIRIREAEGRLLQAGRPANPELESSVEQTPSSHEWKAEIGFSQRFPLTNRLRLEKQISHTELRAAEAEVREVERKLIAAACGAMVNVLTLRGQRILLEKQSKLSRKLVEFLDEVAAKGEGSPLDAGQARIEAATLEAEIRQLDAQEAGPLGTLKSLLGIPAHTPLHVTGELPSPQLPARTVDPNRRADFQAGKLKARAAAQGVALEHARKYDDMELGVFAGSERSEDVPAGYDREAMIGLRFRIPLPLWNHNQGAIAEAQARHERAVLETRALAREIELEAESSASEMERWLRLIGEIEQTLLPLADTQAAEAEKAFRNGQGDIQSVFRSREKRLELANSRLEAVREFHLARVRHNAALGTPN